MKPRFDLCDHAATLLRSGRRGTFHQEEFHHVGTYGREDARRLPCLRLVRRACFCPTPPHHLESKAPKVRHVETTLALFGTRGTPLFQRIPAGRCPHPVPRTESPEGATRDPVGRRIRAGAFTQLRPMALLVLLSIAGCGQGATASDMEAASDNATSLTRWRQRKCPGGCPANASRCEQLQDATEGGAAGEHKGQDEREDETCRWAMRPAGAKSRFVRQTGEGVTLWWVVRRAEVEREVRRFGWECPVALVAVSVCWWMTRPFLRGRCATQGGTLCPPTLHP
jgi:hypothetical protein